MNTPATLAFCFAITVWFVAHYIQGPAVQPPKGGAILVAGLILLGDQFALAGGYVALGISIAGWF